MSIDPTTGLFQRDLPPPDCEFTARGSKTEGIDCWEPATVRHVKDGTAVGLYCPKHRKAQAGLTVENIDN